LSTTALACPAPGKETVLRTVMRPGPHQDNRFWGCPDYPRCRGCGTCGGFSLTLIPAAVIDAVTGITTLVRVPLVLVGLLPILGERPQMALAASGIFRIAPGRPAGAFGITSRPGELIHTVLDVLEREKISQRPDLCRWAHSAATAHPAQGESSRRQLAKMAPALPACPRPASGP
jgi:hypothetical protein